MTMPIDPKDLQAGFSVRRIGHAKRRPKWAKSRKAIEDHVLQKARRNYRIAYAYWFAGRTAPEIAEKEGMSLATVKYVIKSLREEDSK